MENYKRLMFYLFEDWWWLLSATQGRDIEIAQNIFKIFETYWHDHSWHWKALEEHFLMVPLAFQFYQFRGKCIFWFFFSLKKNNFQCWVMAAIVPRPFSGNFTKSETHAVKNSEEVLSYFFHFWNFLWRGGHVISAAILDFRICPAKSEEKKDIKKFVSQNYVFNWNPWTNKY
jgi:hypothetical protein